MKELNPVISFLAFFFVLICCLDLTLPYKGKQMHVIDDLHGKSIEVTSENLDKHSSEYNKGKFMWVESTRILNQPMNYSYMSRNQITTAKTDFNFYIPGIVFIFFLAFGWIYGVFFKKSDYQERRVMYFNLIVGSIVCLMYMISLGKVV